MPLKSRQSAFATGPKSLTKPNEPLITADPASSKGDELPITADTAVCGELHCLTDSELYRAVGRFSKAEIAKAYRSDPWHHNLFLNFWEYVKGETVLESYPWNISLPFADVCNARCTFCDAWLRGEGVLKPADLERFAGVLRFARVLGIQGHGEPLANPHIDNLLSRLAQIIDPRCRAFIITNGVYVVDKLDALLNAQVKTFNFSLNAVSETAHDAVMGLGSQGYQRVQAGLREVLRLRDSGNSDIEVTVSLVLTKDNLGDAADFVRKANDLGVNTIYIRTLMPVGGVTEGLNYHAIPPYLHPEFPKLAGELRAAIEDSATPVIAQPETWHVPVMSEATQKQFEQRVPAVIPRADAIKSRQLRSFFRDTAEHITGSGAPNGSPIEIDGPNPYRRGPRFLCRFIYHNLICNELNFRMVPCCYMADVPGHEPVVFDGTMDFRTYWNSAAFVELRRKLKEGPLLNQCKTCPMQG